MQTYTEPATGYLHGQQVYAGHQQGVVVQQGGTVTTIVTSQTVQQVGNKGQSGHHKRGLLVLCLYNCFRTPA